MREAAITLVAARSWNTIARWLERVARMVAQLHGRRTRGLDLIKPQLVEMQALLSSRERSP